MIELEIQALSETREGLLIEVGRFVLANGFTLQRQRLVQDPHGTLLTMVVRGPARRKRALEAALDGYERIISFELSPFVEGVAKEHFAASRTQAPHAAVPTPAPAPPATPRAAPAIPAATVQEPPPVVATAIAPVAASDAPPVHEEPDFEFILAATPVPPAAPAPAVVTPFVELTPLDADEAAVDKALRALADEYPQIMPRLLALDRGVPDGARESTLALAGQRVGAWVFAREHAPAAPMDLQQAIARIGVPALRALVEVEQEGAQLHIRDSPLCTQDGHSGCRFFSGLLEGLLGPAVASNELSIFAVCCRSCGADACVLAISD